MKSQAFHRVFGDATYAYGNNVGHVRKVEAKEAPYEAGYKGKKEEA